MINDSGYFYPDETGACDTRYDLSVNSAGRYKLIHRERFEAIRPSGRNDFQLLYLAGGSADFIIGNESVHLSEGYVILYYPGERQQYLYERKNHPEVYWLHFTGSQAASWAYRAGFHHSGYRRTGLQSEFVLLFGRIIREIQLKKPRCHPLCAIYTRELLELLIRQSLSFQDASGHGSELVEKAIVHFYQSYQQPLQIRDHADALNVSVCWLIRCFKRYTGVTPQKYLTDIRIAKAKELLYSSTLSCGEIACSVGYPDPLYFSRVFRRETGQSPHAFRKAVREQQTVIGISTSDKKQD